MRGRLTSVLVASTAILLTFVFFAPHLFLLAHYYPETFEWNRASKFLQQSQIPFRHDIEPVMRWRLLPPLVAYMLHLTGYEPLIIPWLGVLAATTYAVSLFQKRSSDWRLILGGTLLFTTTSAILVPIGWLGINDAWLWLGLLVVAFENSRCALIAAMLLCPWIDERFIIGWPLAWAVRCIDKKQSLISWQLAHALWFLPYAAIRIGFTARGIIINDVSFVINERFRRLIETANYIPLGWWMGLRAAWASIGYALWQINKRTDRALFFLIFAATLILPTIASADTSRSVADLVPLVLLGVFLFIDNHSALAPRMVLILGICGLLLPAMHIVSNKMSLIDNLAVEAFRLIRY